MIDNEPEKMSEKEKLAFVREVMGHRKVNSSDPAHMRITALPDGVGHRVVVHENGSDTEHEFEGNGSHHAVAEFVRSALDPSEGKTSGQFERYGGNNS